MFVPDSQQDLNIGVLCLMWLVTLPAAIIAFGLYLIVKTMTSISYTLINTKPSDSETNYKHPGNWRKIK